MGLILAIISSTIIGTTYGQPAGWAVLCALVMVDWNLVLIRKNK